jgi:hypothetical protein
MLEWLAGWVGMALAPELPDGSRRELVAAAARLYVWRGLRSRPDASRAAVAAAISQGPPSLAGGLALPNARPGRC